MKKRIKDILQPDIFAVPPDTPADLVMEIMREKQISCIVVTEEEQPVGIFTERDVVRYLVRRDQDFADSTIAEVMTPGVRTITPEMMLYEAYSVLSENLIRHLVVVDQENKVVGVITQSDLLDQFEYDLVEKGYTVGQLMNRGIVTADPYDSVSRAAKIMAEGSLSFLIICRQLQPLGVITERDMARLAAEEVDIHATLIQDVMSEPVQTMSAEQPAYKAAEKMHEFDIRHLVVVNGAGKAIGVLTQTDLIRGLENTFLETLRVVAREQAEELAGIRHLLTGKSLFLDAIFNSSISAGIVVADRELRVSHLTHSAEFILGVTAEEVVGRDIRTLVEHRNVPSRRFEQGLSRIFGGDTYSFTMQRREGNLAKVIQATLSGILEGDELSGFLLILDDVTEKRITEETMHRLAYYDALTGLANRSMFGDKLKAEFARSRRTDNPFALLLINVDNFRNVNTSLSHQAGDRLLREIARRLDGLLRESDTVARVGSDEFCIILVSTGTTGDALTVAGKIVKRLSPAYELNGTTMTVTFSLGVALYPVHGEDEETLLRNVNEAMQQAKTEGRTNRESNIAVA